MQLFKYDPAQVIHSNHILIYSKQLLNLHLLYLTIANIFCSYLSEKN